MVRFFAKLWLLLALAIAPIGCLPQGGAESALDHVVTSGTVVLLALDSVEAERLRAIEHPTEQDIDAARDRVARLRSARDALEALQSSGDLKGNEAKLELAVKLLRIAMTQAQQEKLLIPPEAEQALRFIEAWISSKGTDDG